MLLRVNQDIQRLESKSEIGVIAAFLCGSRRWGYSGATSDHDIFLIFENRNRPQLFDPFEDFKFSTGDGFNYTGKRVDKFLRQVAENKVESLEILSGESLIETSTHEILSNGFKKLQKYFDYYDIASGYRGMAVSDNRKLQNIFWPNRHPSHTLDYAVKLGCTVFRSGLSTLHFQECIKQDKKEFSAGALSDYMNTDLVRLIPEEVRQAIPRLVHYRYKPVLTEEDVQSSCTIISKWVSSIVDGEKPLRPAVIGDPLLEMYYSPLKTIGIMMETEGFVGHVVNRVNDPLQKECEQIYTDIQKVLR